MYSKVCVEKLEKIIETLENEYLLKLAESRKDSGTILFEDLVKEEGYTMEEIDELAEKMSL